MHKRHLYNAAYAVIQVGISSPKLRVHSSSQWKILEACCVQGHGRFLFNNFKILFPSFGSRKMPQELLLSPWACFSLNNDVRHLRSGKSQLYPSGYTSVQGDISLSCIQRHCPVPPLPRVSHLHIAASSISVKTRRLSHRVIKA